MRRIHRSVLLSEVIECLQIRPGGVYADLTFGEGGHAEAMLERGAEKVLAIDRDLEAIERYRKHGAGREDPRLQLRHMKLSEFARRSEPGSLDGICIDLGVSTRQLLEARRGFTFSEAGPLDMRMDPSESDAKLSDLLGRIDVDALARAIEQNADLKHGRWLARRILEGFRSGRVTDTCSLARLFGGRKGRSHPATVPFMALRMLVNGELREINEGIPPLIDALKPGGRLATLTFHSTEDRAVKKIFQRLMGRCACDEPICRCPREQRARSVSKKPVVPGARELVENPRSRSAKLRCIEKM